ncbi:TPA: hypothetical protein ACX3KG_003605 [Raoultella ornithinolytica]|uniref:hypothetical protein n=1 Tax=Klebsiella pneumoniae TaxID=573 RepID=UPI000E2A4386|nr:hypothetical protein [Klebsiella pneumoniae]SXK95381.1 Uncharacterised protein [Klebsiella pneumoniae]
MSTHTSRIRNMTLQEASIVSEQLLHLLQTVAENYYQLEDAQRFSLMQIAYNISVDIDSWMNAEEERYGGTTKRN